jgi:hypothetical protein
LIAMAGLLFITDHKRLNRRAQRQRLQHPGEDEG